jgi:transposase InsO family protein
LGEFEASEEVLKAAGGGIIRTLGRLKTVTVIDGVSYPLVYSVVPCGAIPYARALLGDELLDHASVKLSKGEVQIWPSESCLACYSEDNDSKSGHLSSELDGAVDNLINNYKPEKVEEVPVKMEISLKDESPISCNPRRLSPKEHAEVEEQIEEWLDKGIITPSHSEFSSQVVVARKKDGSARVCINYKPINRVIVRQHFPLPLIEDILDRLSEAKVFTTLDLKNGFFHVEVAEQSRKYTAFVTPTGQYEFTKVPFGLCNSPSVFQRFISYIFRELVKKGTMFTYLDDIIIISQNETEAVHRLREVLNVSSAHGLEINWSKSQVLHRRIEFLGHVIEDGKIQPTTEKIAALVNYPEPRSERQLRGFLGLASYFRKFVKGFAQIARPLSDLLKTGKEVKFGEEERIAFLRLKELLAVEPVLRIYNQKLETELHTDASQEGFGAVLLQRALDDQQLHPVYYMSCKTSEAEKKLHSYHLEMLAVIKAVQKFRVYLLGIHFKIVTDCEAFEQTLRKDALAPKVARWVMELEQYDYTVEHRAGTRMMHVDALSRNPCSLIVHDPLLDRVNRAQNKDEGIKAIKMILERGETYNDFLLRGDLLYKEEGGIQKLVIPKGMEREIIRGAHEVGHFGKKRTMKRLTSYWIRNVEKKVEECIQNCVPCIVAARKQGKGEGFLNPIPKEDVPLDTIHIDHLGPIPSTKKNYKYILVLIDGFTKFVWLFPTKTLETVEVLEKLRVHQQTFGNPRRIVTDRNKAFMSGEFEKYCGEGNIKHFSISTGVPRGNGQVERVNSTLGAVFAKLSADEPLRWYKHVSRVQRVINSTYHRSIDATPFELLLGVPMRNPEDAELEEAVGEELRADHWRRRDGLRKQAKEAIAKVQEENRRGFNRYRKEAIVYEKGDIVAVKRTQFGSGLKIKNKFLGPYCVTEVMPKDRYKVERIGNCEGPGHTFTVAEYMKPWRGFYRDMEDDLSSSEADEM